MKALNQVLSVAAMVAAGSAELAADYPCRSNAPMVGVAQVTPRYSYRSGYSTVAQPAAPMMTAAPRAAISGGRPVYEADANWEFVRNRARVRGW